MGVAGGQIETAGRFFELSEEESERMAAGTTRRTRHVPTSLLTHWQKPHSGPALVPRFGPERPPVSLPHLHPHHHTNDLFTPFWQGE
jgi:hypothetical protein